MEYKSNINESNDNIELLNKPVKIGNLPVSTEVDEVIVKGTNNVLNQVSANVITSRVGGKVIGGNTYYYATEKDYTIICTSSDTGISTIDLTNVEYEGKIIRIVSWNRVFIDTNDPIKLKNGNSVSFTSPNWFSGDAYIVLQFIGNAWHQVGGST